MWRLARLPGEPCGVPGATAFNDADFRLQVVLDSDTAFAKAARNAAGATGLLT